jgi:multidrug efflux pump
MTTTPMMCARLLKDHNRRPHGRIYRFSEGVFNLFLGGYRRTLSVALRHPLVMILLTGSTVAFTIYLYVIIPKGLFPQQDTGRIQGTIQADQDTSFQAMNQLVSRFAQAVSADPAVSISMAFTGGGRGGGTVNTGRMFISLKDLSVRKLSADQVVARLRPKLARIPGATLYLRPVQDIQVGGRQSNATYQYTLQGDNLKDLLDYAPKLVNELRKYPRLADVSSDQQDRGLESMVTIDRTTASRLNITPQLLDDTLYDAFGQRQVSTMYTPLNQYHVVEEVAPQYWQTPSGLTDIYIQTVAGLTPLSAVAHYTEDTTSLSVAHQGQFPAVTISFNLLPGVSLSDAVTDINQAQQQIDMPPSIHGSFQGTAQAYQASLANEPILITAAILAVYIVLGMLYESFVHPITILSTLPSAGVGALLALLLTHTELDVMGLIGIILLIGIVKKNAIMMIDFAVETQRANNLAPRDAIFQACLLRFRPIMMTTMAALLGALPLAVRGGTGSELRHPLGIAIVGGLLFSQLLTLYTTPVIYLYLDRFRIWCGSLVARPQPRRQFAPA